MAGRLGADRDHGFGKDIRLVEVLGEKSLVEAAVVVKAVASGGRAPIEGESRVARAFPGDVLVAPHAEVLRQGHSTLPGLGGHMLLVARDAGAGVEAGDAVGVSRVCKLLSG